jgi:CPA1 family monovalent cation:H+ antiporter
MTASIVGSSLFLCAAALAGLIIQRVTRMDISLSCVLAGLLAGLLLPVTGIDTGIRASNIQQLVFYFFLPVLIFEAAWHMDPKKLKQWFWPVFILATIGLIIGSITFALVAWLGINHQAFPFVAALLGGAMLAATDPVSVVSALRRLDAPPDLTTLIEGESLFNDATAIVLFTLGLTLAGGGMSESAAGVAIQFMLVFFGGIVCGALMGLIGAILSLALGKPNAAVISQVFLAFASFYVAEHLLHVSGIMSVMSAAMLSRILLKEHEDTLLRDTASSWDWLGLLFNALVFVLLGLVINLAMFREQWLAMLVAIVAALIARGVVVLLIGIATRRSLRPIGAGWQLILWWGGLRGAISVVLALSLPTELPYWWTLQCMVFGVVLFSLLIQGSSAGRLIRRYA